MINVAGFNQLIVYEQGKPTRCTIGASLMDNAWPVDCANGQPLSLSVIVTPEWEDREHLTLGDIMFRRSCV